MRLRGAYPLFPLRAARRGVVMVMALWLILVLTVMAYSLAYEMRLGLKTTTYSQKRVKAYGLARAGLAHAVMDLKNDRLLMAGTQNVGNDRLDEPWAQVEDKLDVEFGQGTYSVLIEDENRKLDLNALTQQGLAGLTHLLEEVSGVREREAKEMANAFLDYRDADILPIGGQGDNEADYWTDYGLKEYGDVLPANWTFRPKNDDLLTIDDLLQVPGFTHTILYGDPDEFEPDPFVRADRKEEDSTALVDYVTVGSGLTTNINTAKPLVLEAILRAAGVSKGEASGYARKIEQFRSGKAKVKENNLPGISDLQQLQQSGLPENVVNQLSAAVPIDVRSRVFTVIARGEFEGVRETLQVKVTAELEQYPMDKDAEDIPGLRDEAAAGRLRIKGDLHYDPAVRVIRNSTN